MEHARNDIFHGVKGRPANARPVRLADDGFHQRAAFEEEAGANERLCGILERSVQDGREGAIVEIFRDKSGAIVALLVDIGSSPEDWDAIMVAPQDIALAAWESND